MSLIPPRGDQFFIGCGEDIRSNVLADSKERLQIDVVGIVLLVGALCVVLLLKPGETGLEPLREPLRDRGDSNMSNQAVGKRNRNVQGVDVVDLTEDKRTLDQSLYDVC